MADNAIGDILLVGAIAGAGWWLLSSMSSTPAVAAPAPSTGTTGTPSPSTGTGINPVAGTPQYSGPSLDQIFTALLAAEQNAMMASVPDPALSCAGDTTMGVTTPAPTITVNTVPVGGGAIATNPNAPRTSAGVATTPIVGSPQALSGYRGLRGYRRGLGANPCASPMATYDVHNWYLTNRATSGMVAPGPPDHTSVLTVQQYWAWAAPLLQQANPGLSGYRGLGHFGAIGQIVMRGRR